METDAALALLRAHKIMPVHSAAGLESLLEAIAGEPIRGSWWGHPKGQTIYEVFGALQRSGEVLWAKLVGGKQTAIHRSLWAPLLRVVTDEAWRTATRKRLNELERTLLKRVEEVGSLRMDHFPAPGSHTSRAERNAARKARLGLERRMLVQGSDIHTQPGYHVAVLTAWTHWAQAPFLESASQWTIDEAVAELGRWGGEAVLAALGTEAGQART